MKSAKLRKKPRVRVRRVTLRVYCRAKDVAAIRVGADEWFRMHEYELWRPAPASVDNGVRREAEEAAKWFAEGNRMAS